MNIIDTVFDPIILFAFLFITYYALVDWLERAGRKIVQAVRHVSLTDTLTLRCYRDYATKHVQR
jgi:predicted PurR-regulated permease PerM